MPRRVATVIALAVLCAVVAGAARADGDPASDVLYSESVFLPSDVPASTAERARLDGLVRAATAAGFPVKVAIVGSSYDLGSVTALWRKPQLYARFLGVELSYVFRGRLVVVMPNGIAVSRGGKASPSDQALAAGVVRGSLVATAADAVQALAQGHCIPLSVGPSRVRPVGGATRAGGGWRAPVALAAGLLMIAAVWARSLRLRPVHRGGNT